jgi:SlyX protein
VASVTDTIQDAERSAREGLERRIVDLELRFMLQEKLTEELNQVIVEQQRALDRLALEMRTLQEQVRAGAGGDATPKDERPPHY